MLQLELTSKLPEGVHRSLLQRAVREVVAQTQPQDGVVNLKLVDDAEIRALNKKYSGNDKATDVLSFSYIEDGVEPVQGELGDIAISLETAASQAEQASTDLETEVVLLLVHGILHILGYDHANADDQAKVEAIQLDVMKALNLTYRKFKWDSSAV